MCCFVCIPLLKYFILESDVVTKVYCSLGKTGTLLFLIGDYNHIYYSYTSDDSCIYPYTNKHTCILVRTGVSLPIAHNHLF